MEKKKSFILYLDYKKHIDLLSDEERGKLFSALFEYVETGIIPELPPMATMAFSFMQAQLERDWIKYQAIVERNQANGLRGGRPRKPESETKAVLEEPKKPSGLFGNPEKPNITQRNPKKHDNDNGTDNGTDNDNGTDISTGEISISPKKRAKRFSPPTVEEIRAYCIERKNQVDPERFVDYYQAREWMLGKDKMKDWMAAVRTWERNGYGNGQEKKNYKTAPLPKRKYDGLTE